jgi:hypothetical protein
MPINLTITIGKNVYSQTFPGEPKDKVSIQVQTSTSPDYFNSEEGNPGSLSDLKNPELWKNSEPAQIASYKRLLENRTDPDGKIYSSVAAMCNAWNIPAYIYRNRIKTNWSKEDALLTPVNSQNKKKDK